MLTEEKLAALNVDGAFGFLAMDDEKDPVKSIELQIEVVKAICPDVTDSEELKRIVTGEEVKEAFLTLARRQNILDKRQSEDGYDSEEDPLVHSMKKGIENAEDKVMSAVRKAAGLA